MAFNENKLISEGSPSLLLTSSTYPEKGVAGGRKTPHLSLLDNYQHNCTLLRDKPLKTPLFVNLDNFQGHSLSRQNRAKYGETPLLRERPQKKRWRPSQARCFTRLRSGCLAHRGEKLRFLTLTTADKMKRTKEDGFRALKERIRRQTPLRVFNELGGKGSFHEFSRHFYPNKNPLSTLKFQYTKIKTSEGVSGVFHIVFFGDYLPQKWVSSAWEDLTGSARIVDIRGMKVQRGSEKRVSIYVVNQYVSGGQTEYVRFSNSWYWCFLGFLGRWDDLRKRCSGLNYEQKWEVWENEILEQKHPSPLLGFLDVDEQNPRLIYKGEGVNFDGDFHAGREGFSERFNG